MSEATPPTTTPEAGEQKAGENLQNDYLSMLPEDIQNAVKKIKEKGIDVYMTFLGDRAYLFRTLNVIEFMKLQKMQEERSKAEGATEAFLQQALFESIVMAANLGIIVTTKDGKEQLLPPITRENIKGQPAGVPSSLAQQIMTQSGFDNNPVTVKL